MRRLAAFAPFVALLVAAPAALAHDGGQGWYGVGRRQGHDEGRLHPDHLLPGLRAADEPAPGAPREAQGTPQGGREGPRGRLARRLVAPAAMDEVRYERIGAAAVVTIDRPARRNAVDGPTAARLRECYDAFEADDEARVFVLTGARRRGVLCRRRPHRAAHLRRPHGRPGRPDGLHAAARRPSRRSRRSAAGAWPAGSSSRCGATCGSPSPARAWATPSAAGASR